MARRIVPARRWFMKTWLVLAAMLFSSPAWAQTGIEQITFPVNGSPIQVVGKVDVAVKGKKAASIFHRVEINCTSDTDSSFHSDAHSKISAANILVLSHSHTAILFESNPPSSGNLTCLMDVTAASFYGNDIITAFKNAQNSQLFLWPPQSP
jgi:hypothetical protein